jgi:GntR family transcriptional regulator of arabinose operon
MKKPAIPNYQRIKEALLEEIERGHYTPGHLFVTQQDICARFGVSRITADRAINDLVEAGILFRRRGHGTFVAEHATHREISASLRGSEHRIGCIMSYIHSGHTLALMHGIERRCRESNCSVLLFNSEETVETEEDNLLRARRAGVDGLIVYPVDGFANTAHFQRIRQEGIPLVMVDRYYPMIPTDVIVPDNVDAGYQVTRHLIQQGHRRISIVWSEIGCTSVHERLIGYQRALQEAQLPIDTSLSALRPYYSFPESERQALLTEWRAMPDPPTAIITVSGRVLTRLTQDLLTLKVRLGEEITLASMDSIDPDASLAIAEVQVTLPSFMMGYEAASLLLERLHGQHPVATQHRILPVEMTIPSSVIVTAHESAE